MPTKRSSAFLALAVFGTAISSASAGSPGTFNVQVAVTPTVAMTNVYFMYSEEYVRATGPTDDYSDYQIYAVSIGNLAAATAGSPDIINLTLPVIEVDDPKLGAILFPPNGPELYGRGFGYALTGLYAPSGVTTSFETSTRPGSSFDQTYTGIAPIGTPAEPIVATALANGDIAALKNFYQFGLGLASTNFGDTADLYNFSAPVGNGTVTATIVPEPTALTALGVGLVGLLCRRRLT